MQQQQLAQQLAGLIMVNSSCKFLVCVRSVEASLSVLSRSSLGVLDFLMLHRNAMIAWSVD
jgi:hypothetical protein